MLLKRTHLPYKYIHSTVYKSINTITKLAIQLNLKEKVYKTALSSYVHVRMYLYTSRTHSYIAHTLSLHCLQLTKPTLPSEVILWELEEVSSCWQFGLCSPAPPAVQVVMADGQLYQQSLYQHKEVAQFLSIQMEWMGFRDHLEEVGELLGNV